LSSGPQVPQPLGTAPGDGDSITLAWILNVFWRRKILIIGLTLLGLGAGFVYGLVVTPLYLATAQVLPGITAYTDTGAPVREWRQKDIVRFYNRGLHAESVRRQMGWAEDQGRPIIQADFIQRGAQNIQGGTVITLTTLSPTPEEAAAVMDAAIEAFDEFAAADTVSSGLWLTRRGLRIRIAQLQTEREQIQNERQRIDIKIAAKQSELVLIDAEQRRVKLELEKIEQDNQYRQRLAQRSEVEAEATRNRLTEVDGALQRLKRSDPGLFARGDSLVTAVGRDGFASWLIGSMSRSDAEAVSSMILGGVQIQEKAYQDQARADSVQHEILLAGFFMEDLKIKRNAELEQQRTVVRGEVADLELERDGDFMTKAAELDQQILGHRAQLNAISPLERIGHVTATKHPVRPRKPRAMIILMLLGLFGSVALALCWEYFSVNKQVILGRGSARD
jgi:hypothetical protein